MRILAIETSCDETSAAIVENGSKILSNTVATSSDMHAKTGGIIPERAARQQLKSIIPVINESLTNAFSKNPISNLNQLATKIDALAVTVGPGLIGSLLVGVEAAKTLSLLWKKPIVPVNHLVAHIYANFINQKSKKTQQPKFPILALVVSGGHTDLVLMKAHGKIKWLGGTRDDAGGEAFDKCARLLGLGYPGGPAISAAAEKYFDSLTSTQPPQLNLFPRPMINDNNLDFSFSGLKTSVLNYINSNQPSVNKLSTQTVSHLSAEVQEAIVDCLVAKTLCAVKKFNPKSVLLAGGVAANKRLRQKLRGGVRNMKGVAFHVAPTPLCTDNAAYIASCACFNFKPVSWEKINANPQLTISD